MRSVVKNADFISLVSANSCDIYAFTETWLNPSHATPSVLSSLTLDYNINRCDRPKKMGGGGILLTRWNLSFSPLFGESVEDAYEILCGEISYASTSSRMLTVYRTPSCTAAKTDQLFKVMSNLPANEKHVIVAGDFNIPEFRPTSNSKSPGALALHELINIMALRSTLQNLPGVVIY